jgi:hypothetical protein
MTYELCICDEYGSKSILSSGNDIDELVLKAKEIVNAENMNNALVWDQKVRDWSVCFVEFLDDTGELIDNAYYAGKSGTGKDILFLKNDDKHDQYILEKTNVGLRLYVGTFSKDRDIKNVEIVYAQKPQPKEPGKWMLVNSLSDQELEGKSVLFINNKN